MEIIPFEKLEQAILRNRKGLKNDKCAEDSLKSGVHNNCPCYKECPHNPRIEEDIEIEL